MTFILWYPPCKTCPLLWPLENLSHQVCHLQPSCRSAADVIELSLASLPPSGLTRGPGGGWQGQWTLQCMLKKAPTTLGTAVTNRAHTGTIFATCGQAGIEPPMLHVPHNLRTTSSEACAYLLAPLLQPHLQSPPLGILCLPWPCPE